MWIVLLISQTLLIQVELFIPVIGEGGGSTCVAQPENGPAVCVDIISCTYINLIHSNSYP